MKSYLKRVICSALVLVLLFSVSGTAFASVDETDIIQSEMLERETHNAISGSEIDLTDYIPDLVAFKNDILSQILVDDSNLTDADGYGYVDLSKYKLPVNVDLYSAISDFIFYESPELFRITGVMANLGGKNESQIVGIKTNYIYEKPEHFERDYKITIAAANEMLKGIEGNDSLNDIEKALLLHDRLATFCEYDVINLEADTLPNKAFNAYGVFGTGVAVCMGYALAYDYLLERVGIESEYCSSNKLNHAWNIVYIDDKPYHVDVTWDDVSNDVSGQVLHENFLRSTEGIKETGHKYGLFNRIDFSSAPNDTIYDKYFWQDSLTAFELLDNKIYYIDSDYMSSENKSRQGKLIRLDDIADTTPETLITIDDVWKKNEDNTKWVYNFSKLACGRDLLFYSTPDKIYSFNPNTDEKNVVMTASEYLTESEKASYQIFGLRYDGCVLSGEFSTSANYTVTTKSEKPFSKEYHNTAINKIIVPPTETKKGVMGSVCSDCEYMLSEKDISALGSHNWGAWYYDKNNTPNCTESGIRIRDCKDAGCSVQMLDYVAAKGHNYSSEWTLDLAPTCLDTGLKSHHCTRCENRKNVTIVPVTNKHTPNSTWLIGESATCTKEGYNYKKCLVCDGEAERQVVEKKGHNTKTIDSRVATCTVNGYTGDKKCSSCGVVVSKGETIVAPGHKPSNWIIDSNPTETTVGSRHKECTVCYEILETESFKSVTELSAPTVKISNTAKGIKLTWGKVENAESYRVYRRTYNTKTKKYSEWTTLSKAQKGTSFVDTKVKLGTTYSYMVKAINSGVLGKGNATKNLKFNVTPTVTVANASKGISVNWSPIANATGYEVYSSTYNAKTKKWSSFTKRATAKANAKSWTDTKAKSGTKYKYTVKALNGKVASSSAKTTSGLMFLTMPKTTVKAVKNGITVTWTQSTGATSYEVYRAEYNKKTKKYTAFKKVATAKSTAKSYTDKTAKKGVKYKYTVKAVNGKVASAYKEVVVSR